MWGRQTWWSTMSRHSKLNPNLITSHCSAAKVDHIWIRPSKPGNPSVPPKNAERPKFRPGRSRGRRSTTDGSANFSVISANFGQSPASSPPPRTELIPRSTEVAEVRRGPISVPPRPNLGRFGHFSNVNWDDTHLVMMNFGLGLDQVSTLIWSVSSVW